MLNSRLYAPIVPIVPLVPKYISSGSSERVVPNLRNPLDRVAPPILPAPTTLTLPRTSSLEVGLVSPIPTLPALSKTTDGTLLPFTENLKSGLVTTLAAPISQYVLAATPSSNLRPDQSAPLKFFVRIFRGALVAVVLIPTFPEFVLFILFPFLVQYPTVKPLPPATAEST